MFKSIIRFVIGYSIAGIIVGITVWWLTSLGGPLNPEPPVTVPTPTPAHAPAPAPTPTPPPPILVWQKFYGSSDENTAHSVQQTTDGGYIIAGESRSYRSDGSDAYLLKTDSKGNEQWSAIFDVSDYDVAYSVQQTTDGGYIIAGKSRSHRSDDSDVYLVKTDSKGNEQWSATFDVLGEARSVQQTIDGGYIIAGDSWSDRSDNLDAFILRLEAKVK